MPYIITTRTTGKRPTDNPLGMWAAMAKQGALRDEVVSRRAVATLDEAREEASPLTHELTLVDIPEQGGTIALPDGTMIEVESVSWGEFWDDHLSPDAARQVIEQQDAMTASEWYAAGIVAYNAAQ